MAILNPRELKNQAQERIGQSRVDPRILVLIYTGVTVGLSLLVNGLHLLLQQQIGGTGGLGGLGTRSLLQTLQTLLSYFSTFFSPFWTAGFLYAIILLVRRLNPEPRDLLFGFRRLPRILSYTLLELLVVTGVMILCTNLASTLFLMTPLSEPMVDALAPMLESADFDVLELDVIPFSSFLPLLLLFLALFVPFFARVSYSLRLSVYLLVEGPGVSALGAMLLSRQMMKGHKMQMFKLDLSFWWFYVLEGLLVIVCYLDVILPALGISLPFDSTVAYFVFLALYGVLQMGLHYWKKCQVETTYVLAYEAIVHPETVQ